ncbi:unnamed protein product [Somion occarium]|uniref:Histone deacetylase complex subunit SAP30 Sin3 binding domain-containing protein n=1 Tax=Somion occarium TaxID=3059160 RepID=A0ABP1CSK1_9APHY
MPQIANTTPSTSTHAAPTSSRARNTGGPRKRVNPAADDATYHGTTSLNVGAGAKRGATDKADGEPRTKRKRVDHGGAHATVSGSGVRRGGVDRTVDANEKLSLIDFTTLPTAALHRYLAQFDLIPELDPPPTSAEDPLPPSHLLRPKGHRHSTSSPPPAALPITPANRPRREFSTSASRRRSSRLLEDDRRSNVTPTMADVGEVHGALAALAERHFREHAVKEVDTLTLFMCAVRAKGKVPPSPS